VIACLFQLFCLGLPSDRLFLVLCESVQMRDDARSRYRHRNTLRISQLGLYCSLNSGCEKVHVDRFARRLVGTADRHADEDYAMPDRHHRDNAFMARAIQLSLDNVKTGHGGPFGTVIVKDGKLVAEAANQVTATNDPTAHAEVVAIRQACVKLGSFELRGCVLYTSCEPCPMCLGAIYWARVEKVYFGNGAEDAAKVGFDDSAIYAEIKKPHADREIPMVQMMREEALAALRAWELQPSKIRY
jgi:guanine deaminase